MTQTNEERVEALYTNIVMILMSGYPSDQEEEKIKLRLTQALTQNTAETLARVREVAESCSVSEVTLQGDTYETGMIAKELFLKKLTTLTPLTLTDDKTE